MAFWDDIWNWVTSSLGAVKQWIIDQLSVAQQWVIAQIVALTKEINVWKYQFRKQIAAWLSDPVRFWLTIAGVAVLIYFIPEMVAWFESTAFYATCAAAMAYVEGVAGDFLLKIGYIQALNLHKIGLILLPDYQAFWGKLDEAFAGMAEEINLGVGTINVLMQSVRGLYYSTYAMFGVSSDMIETTFYDDSTKWIAGAQKRWEEYVRNPQSIFTDIQNDLIFPILEKQSLAGEESAKVILKINADLQLFIKNTNDIRVNLNSLINGLPDEIKTVVLNYVKPGLDKLNTFYEDDLLPWMKKINDSAAVIETSLSEIYATMAMNEAKKEDLITISRLTLFSDTLDTKESKMLMSELLDKIMSTNSDTLKDAMLLANMRQTLSVDTGVTTFIPVPIFSGTVKSGITLKNIVIPVGGWFVGEY